MMIRRLVYAFSFSVLVLAAPTHAQAQCETAITANTATQGLLSTQTTAINAYMQQELNYISADFKETATTELMDRYEQFRNRILDALNAYAGRVIPDMEDASKQQAATEIDQTRQLGSFADARVQAENIRAQGLQELRARRDYTPSETTCVLDTLGPAQTLGYRRARGIARGLARDAQRDLGGQRGTAGAQGPAAVVAAVHDEFADAFCDPARGDQGCDTPGRLAGRNNDLGGMLWGTEQTTDLSDEDNQLALRAVTRNIAGPLPDAPVPASLVPTAAGAEEMLRRRAARARINTIYNVIGQMTGERAGGTGADTQEVRTEAGLPPEDASTDASYSEINVATARDRFTNPQYLFQMVNYPAVIVREQGAINATRLMQLSDIYKRLEEMIWVEAAALGAILDREMGKD